MSKVYRQFNNFIQGIADYEKEDAPNSIVWMRSLDHRTDPKKLTILPKTTKESGSVVTGLIKWMERSGDEVYGYDDAGALYKRDENEDWSKIRTIGNSHGNGLVYYGEDDFLYYMADKTIGRYGPLNSAYADPTFADDFLTSEGGVPTNTYSMDFESGSSMYATAADSASLSITGNITLETYVKPESLPAVGSSMTLLAKWDESGALRSYKMDLYGISGYFGDGSDGALTISSNTTQAPIDSACTGTIATKTLSATNASFASGQLVLIHQTRGTGAGTWMRNTISSYTSGTITLTDNLNATYTSGAQVIVVPEYTDVTIDSGFTWSAKAWNGTVGGILVFVANGTVTVTGTISAVGKGFRGGSGASAGSSNSVYGDYGENQSGASGNSGNLSASNSGGGGGRSQDPNSINGSGGGSGGHATAGQDGWVATGTPGGGVGGSTSGDSTDLTTMLFGGGGGGGGASSAQAGGTGGAGGGIIFISGVTVSVTGSITANGAAGSNGVTSGSGISGGGGGGAGGAVLLKAQTATLGTNLITASGGLKGQDNTGAYENGNKGGDGRIHLDYLTSYTGTTTPTINVTEDNTLVTNTTYQLRFLVSDDGTNVDTLTKNISLSTAVWVRLGVSWTASTSTCEFYLNGVSQGTSTGSRTGIHNNATLFTIGADENSGGSYANFFDGKLDDARVWNTVRTTAQHLANKDREVIATDAGLAAYWQFDNSASDSHANANNLTLVNSPTYSTDVPFSAPTSRLDKDQEDTSTGQTYDLPTAIDEGSTARQTFVPAKDPQKSIEVNISAKGDSADWTLTVHDALNRVVATATILNAALPSSGKVEFIFATPWTPVIGASYHFHLTASNTTGTPAIVTGTVSSLETAQFTSYYQFLIEDTKWHTAATMLNFVAIANGRYVAILEPGATYNPHRLTLPAEWKVRCFGYWNEYLAIGCWRGDTVEGYDQGMIFLWNGTSTTYDYYVPVPHGAVNALLGSGGELHIFAGYQGDHLVYTGGERVRKIKRIPKVTDSKYVEVYPGAMSMWRTLLRYGVSDSDSTSIERGVYTWGSLNVNHPESLSYDYPISTGNRTATTIQVGSIYPIDKKLLISWRDGTNYGVDVVDPTGTPFSTATIEFGVRDEGSMYQDKLPLKLRADFKALATSERVDIKYKLDRATDWTKLETPLATVGEEEVGLQILEGRSREYQLAADLYSGGSTSPTLQSLALEIEAVEGEEEF